MFGAIVAILLTSYSAEAAPPRAPDRAPESGAIEPRCVIPVYVNVKNATPELIPTYMGAVYNALYRWNKAKVGVFFKLEDFLYPEDRREGAITIVMSAFPEERADREIGLTYNVGRPGPGITRSRIMLNVEDPWCITGGNQAGCYQMENVIVHEVGHAIGLPHNEDVSSVMNFGIRQDPIKPFAQGDIADARTLFSSDTVPCAVKDDVWAWSINND